MSSEVTEGSSLGAALASGGLSLSSASSDRASNSPEPSVSSSSSSLVAAPAPVDSPSGTTVGSATGRKSWNTSPSAVSFAGSPAGGAIGSRERDGNTALVGGGGWLAA